MLQLPFLSHLNLQSSTWPREGNMESNGMGSQEIQVLLQFRSLLCCLSSIALWCNISHFTFPTLSSYLHHKLHGALIYDGLCTPLGVILHPPAEPGTQKQGTVMDLPTAWSHPWSEIVTEMVLAWAKNPSEVEHNRTCRLSQDLEALPLHKWLHQCPKDVSTTQHLQLEKTLIPPTNCLTPRKPHAVHPFCTAVRFFHKQDFRSRLREKEIISVTKGRGTKQLLAGCRLMSPLHRGISSEILSTGHLVELLHLLVFIYWFFKEFTGLTSLVYHTPVVHTLQHVCVCITRCSHQDPCQHKRCCCMDPLLLQTYALLLYCNLPHHTPEFHPLE